MRFIYKNIEEDIRMYLKDDGFRNFKITDICESTYTTSKQDVLDVYRFTLYMSGMLYSYMIQRKKVDGYSLKRNRMKKLEKIFRDI